MEEAPNLEVSKIEELKEIRDTLYEKEGDFAHDKFVERAKYLQNKYPDFKKYKLYHVLSMSDPLPSSTEFDFPGDDSVESFIRNL